MSTAKSRLLKELLAPRKILSPQLKEAAKRTRWNIVRGDKVQVIQNHPERGKQGIVKKVIRSEDRVIVEGVNVHPRRVKPKPDRGLAGLTIMTERTIHYSKVALVCPVTNLPTRVHRKILEDGTKVRISKKSGAIIPKPTILMMNRHKPNPKITDDDTVDPHVWEITFDDPALRANTNTTSPMDTSA